MTYSDVTIIMTTQTLNKPNIINSMTHSDVIIGQVLHHQSSYAKKHLVHKTSHFSKERPLEGRAGSIILMWNIWYMCINDGIVETTVIPIWFNQFPQHKFPKHQIINLLHNTLLNYNTQCNNFL